MLGPVLWTSFQHGSAREVVSDPSFEAVWVFSAIGIIFSLVFLLTIGPAFDCGFTE